MSEKVESSKKAAAVASTPMFARREMNRRDFLKMTGAGLAGAALLGVAGCGGGGIGGGVQEIVVTFGPDDSGNLKNTIDRFNDEYDGQYSASWREMPADSGQHFDQLKTELQAGSSDFDAIGGDVIWPAQFASQGFIVDLSDRFPADQQSKFLSAPIEANTYQGAIYGVPWRTDAGMLYYRKDLLEQSGFSNPPTTWDELKQQAQRVMQDSGTKYGFIFEGANYEGGVCNGLEYIWSSGGEVLDSNNNVVVNSSEAANGLSTEQSMPNDSVAPSAVSTYKEDEVRSTFLNGDAVFARQWPFMYALISDTSQSNITTDQVGVAALPAASGGQSISALGGWNWFINANSGKQDAAWAWIDFATSSEQQKNGALEGSFLPSLQALYDDQEVTDKVPVVPLARQAAQNTRPRPVSPYYSDMSLRMAEQFNNSLKGSSSPEDALSTLQDDLTNIVKQAQ